MQTLVSIPLRYAKNDTLIYIAGALLSGFQFLLGTLKTVWDLWDYGNLWMVSIPLRYAKNTICPLFPVYLHPSFNSS